MKITLSSVLVDDQEKALQFYTSKLQFQKKTDIPMGVYRWLTLVAPEAPDQTELVLEPISFEPAKVYQEALFDAGIPHTAFEVKDINQEYDRLVKAGVIFKTKPMIAGSVILAVFNDTCGNYIQLFQLIVQ